MCCKEKKNHTASVAFFLVGKVYIEREKLNNIVSRNNICIYANLALVFEYLLSYSSLGFSKCQSMARAVRAYGLGTDNSLSPSLPACGRGTVF